LHEACSPELAVVLVGSQESYLSVHVGVSRLGETPIRNDLTVEIKNDNTNESANEVANSLRENEVSKVGDLLLFWGQGSGRVFAPLWCLWNVHSSAWFRVSGSKPQVTCLLGAYFYKTK
jgi:hypothetical protein